MREALAKLARAVVQFYRTFLDLPRSRPAASASSSRNGRQHRHWSTQPLAPGLIEATAVEVLGPPTGGGSWSSATTTWPTASANRLHGAGFEEQHAAVLLATDLPLALTHVRHRSSRPASTGTT